jgi:transcriptional regulator with XRE-family HTH domain
MNHMPTDPDIGPRIRKRRQELGLTLQQLADRLGVAESTVVHWETGKHYPKRKLGALEAVLGIDLDGSHDPFTFATPDEAAIWSLDRFSEHERRILIRALRETRGQPLTHASPAAHHM